MLSREFIQNLITQLMQAASTNIAIFRELFDTVNNRETLDIVNWVVSTQGVDKQTWKNVIFAAQERLANMQLQSPDFFNSCV